MSSYRSSYIPYRQNFKDKYATNTNNRYSSRTSAYGTSSAVGGANRAPSVDISCSSTGGSGSGSGVGVGTNYNLYRKHHTIPTVLKKYSNFSLSASPDKDNDTTRCAKNDGEQTSRNVSVTSPCRPFSKFAAYESPTKPQGLRYGSATRFGSQIARSPIKEKTLPVFGVSMASSTPSEQRSSSPDKLLLVSRATSPTPPSNSCFLLSQRRIDNDDVLILEMCKPTARASSLRHTVACQTEPEETNRAPMPPSRVASLNNKFTSIGNANSNGNSGGSVGDRYQTKVTGGNYAARPTDLPIRSNACSLMPYSYHNTVERASSSESNKGRLSPNVRQSFRTPSPLASLSTSLSSLIIDAANSKLQNENDPSDTESESSYEEDYPLKSDAETYSINTMTASDKPPRYPLSPNCKRKSINAPVERSVNARCFSASSNSSVKLDSSCEDASDNDSRGERIATTSNCADKTTSLNNRYAIRKIDSGDSPWWLNSKSSNDSSPPPPPPPPPPLPPPPPRFETAEYDVRNVCGYRIRKMDSAESPWWCKTTSDSSENLSETNREPIGGSSRLFATNEEVSSPVVSNYKIRKMDSCEILWDSDRGDKGDRCDENADREFDSEEKPARWTDDESVDKSSANSVPEWWNDVTNNTHTNGGCVENYKSTKVLRITKIEPVRKLEKDDLNANTDRMDEAGNISNVYKISKIDSGDEAWWLNEDKGEESLTNTNAIETSSHEPTDGSLSDRNYKLKYINELDNLLLYIGDHTNIDELLGTEVPPPAAPVTPTGDGSSSDDELTEGCRKITAGQVKIHDGSAYTSTIRRRNYQLDDAALQLYKDGDYSSYLDLDSSISEQQEEFEGFQPSRKDCIIMRTQLSVRVHLIIEKLMKSEGRELRRALFSLKQIFQEDKDLVHEFVQNDGLDCLIKVGTDVDQNYQNYILRALGQVMLYVDGMNGVMEHNATIQWLYSLVSSKFRLVVKTALKLLLVFVEYVETNCLLLIRAIHALNTSQGALPWSNIMRLLHEYDANDTELLIYAVTLINKTLNGIPDQDMYYDQVDLLEEQDMESVVRKYMSKPGVDLDLLRQFQIYEAVLQHEDGEYEDVPLKQLDETIRKTLRNRKSMINGSVSNEERRKSRRHSTGTTTLPHTTSVGLAKQHSETSSPEDYRIKAAADGVGVTPGLRRRRERAERQRSLLREQYENNLRASMDTASSEDGLQNGTNHYSIPNVYVNSTVNKLESLEDVTNLTNIRNYQNGEISPNAKREATVKDITQKLATLQTPGETNKSQSHSRVEEMKGIISKAMEGLAKSQSRGELIKSPTSECSSSLIPIRIAESKKSETDLHWEELLATSTRALKLCDLDFSDLQSDDEHDVLAPACNSSGMPPPPPPCSVPPPVPCVPKIIANKNKKTVKLFWKEVREDPIVITKLNSKPLIWDEMFPVSVDTQRLEHLFESRAKDLITKKQHELNKNKEIIVLDPKRSNAINIGMTKLPPPRSIKTAILKMDSTVMNREGIEKLLTMLPTEDERSKIQEAQAANPDLPLGSAEHFLLTLASISELTARLKLWAFKLNYENIEKEIVDPLMDLKQGIEVLRSNKTFRAILSTLLSIGIFLNGTEVKGFQVEYLSKVPEVKDTVHKHSLLHHLCHIVMEKFPDSTDLYSEIGAVTRASRVDFDELSNSILRVEQECKASFDHLKAIAKHDGNTGVKLKISDFLADCAERIIALGKIHRRVLNRFFKFCLWLGIPLHRIQATKPNELCKIISEFALEYRTTRERVIQQLEKKASHRERNKTRGKMITEIGKFRSKEDRQDAELRKLLGKEHSPEHNNTTNLQCGSLPWRRLRKDVVKNVQDPSINRHVTDVDDELLETLVKTATKTPTSRNAPRERKRTRHSDRKSLRRTLRNGLTEEEMNHLAAYIKSY